jgi:anti-anti-sigma regulatory factor
MKPHLTSSSSSAMTRHFGNQDRTTEVLAHPVSIVDRAGRAQAAHARPQVTLAGTPKWRHKLILTGTLDYRTVIELEDEIECLYEEGVTILTLDLRRLDVIDSDGAKAVALRGVACKRRGRDFAVVPGSLVVHRVLAEAGAESLLDGDPSETGVVRLVTKASDSSSRDTSTVTIKNL